MTRGSKLTNKGGILDKERVKNDPSVVNFDPSVKGQYCQNDSFIS